MNNVIYEKEVTPYEKNEYRWHYKDNVLQKESYIDFRIRDKKAKKGEIIYHYKNGLVQEKIIKLQNSNIKYVSERFEYLADGKLKCHEFFNEDGSLERRVSYFNQDKANLIQFDGFCLRKYKEEEDEYERDIEEINIEYLNKLNIDVI